MTVPTGQSSAAPGEFVQSQVDLSVDDNATDEKAMDEVFEEETSVSEPKEYVIEPEMPTAADVPQDGEAHPNEAPPVAAPAVQPVPEAAEEAVVNDIAKDSKEEPVLDLYAIGAVDYEPSVHQNV